MPTRGRYLEILIEHLQRRLSPEGMHIRSPERFYKDAKPIGEIDVTIRGDLGSAKVFIGIECRDRPSDGPQGLDWIQQILGKKQLLKVDKMVAVSSTGFTPGAAQLAAEHGIDTLVAANVTETEVDHFLHLAEFALCVYRFEPRHVKCKLVAPDGRLPGDVNKTSVRDEGFPSPVPFPLFVQALGSLLVEHWDPELKFSEKWANANFEVTRDDPFLLSWDGPEHPTRLTLKMRVWREVRRGKVVLTRCSSASNQPDAYVGVVRATLAKKPLQLFFTVDPLSLDNPSRFVGKFCRPNGEPFFPTGTPIQMRMYSPTMSWAPKAWEYALATAPYTGPRVTVAVRMPNGPGFTPPPPAPAAPART